MKKEIKSKKKIRIPVPKKPPKVEADKKVYNRKREKAKIHKKIKGRNQD